MADAFGGKNKTAARFFALLLAGAVAGAALLTGCGANKEEREIKLGVMRIEDSMPLYVAQEDGLFEQNGVKVTLLEFSSASDLSRAAEAGELDGCMTDMVVQNLMNKGGAGLRTVAIARGSTREEGRFLVVSSPGSGITQPSQLEGRTLAISEGTMMEYLVDSYMQELGVDQSKVAKVHVPSLSLRLDMVLEGGEIDAAILPDPLAEIAVQSGALAVQSGAHTVIDDTRLQQNYSQSVIVLSGALIAEDGDTVQRFLAAYNAAIARINQNPDSYKELFVEVANIPAPIAAQYQVPSYTPDSLPTPGEVRRVVAWMAEKGLVTEAVAYEDVVATL